MRNFKKFLALVLAMLMVSACAVSVAAFDDVAATDDIADAVELLADLGVIKGRNDGTNNFYPNDTLTREEAAVIAAKILAGAKSVEWTAATTRFADVVDEWSFAYINYVDAENVMIGNANGEFNPKGMLQIDEAIKIALAIADTKAAFNASVEQAKNPTMAWWTFYVQAANEIGLTDDIGAIRNYQAKCSRGTFAQLIYNAFNLTEKNDIAANFGYDEITAYVDVDDNGIVTLTSVDNADVAQKITAELFNAALKEAGYTETAADLETLNSKVFLSWLKTETNLEIVTVKVLTTAKVVKYNDAEIKLENVYDDTNNDGTVDTLNTKYIVIGGVKYEVGVADNKDSNPVLGGAAIETVGIALTINGDDIEQASVVELPKYFKAFLYDDNSDGDFERCDIVEYAIASVKKTAPTSSNGLKCDLYTVNFIDGTTVDVNDAANEKAAKWSGEAVVADNETPMLIDVNCALGGTVDIIEIAASVSGKLTNLVKATSSVPAYAVINDTKYFYENTGVTVDSATLKQTVTVFTINDKLVKVAAASFAPMSIVVDKATINDAGNVVLYGYDADKFTPATIELNGEYKNGKYVAAAAHYEANDNDTDSKKFDKLVTLGGSKNSAGAWVGTTVTFAEGAFYDLVKTTDGIYYVGKSMVKVEIPSDIEGEEPTVVEYEKTLDYLLSVTLAENAKFKVDEKYVYVDGIAKYHNDGAIVVGQVLATGDAAKNAYSTTYTFATSFAEAEGVTAKSFAISDLKVKFIYVTNDGSSKSVVKSVADLGQTIVQLCGTYESVDFDYYYYSAVDLFEGKVVTVKSTLDDLTAGTYAFAKDGLLVENEGELAVVYNAASGVNSWMDNRTITYKVVESGSLVKKIQAKPVYLEIVDDVPTYKVADWAEYGWPMITVYTAGSDGIIDLKDGAPVTAKADATIVNASASYLAYVVEGKIIIVK